MTCPLCGEPEGRERCCWPMADSPLSFGHSPDRMDIEVWASRLPAYEFDAPGFAEQLGVCTSYFRQMRSRGLIGPPSRTEPCAGGAKHFWSARQVAAALMARAS